MSAVLLLVLAASCSAPPTPAQKLASAEQTALAPLKAKYPDIISAFAIRRNRLDIAIDANAYIQTDDPVIDRFKKDAAAAWRTAWIKAHPHQHAQLTVRFMDFMNRVWTTLHAKA